MKQIIPIASDHGGYEMKEFLIEKLLEAGYEVKDFGTHGTESVDYPDMIHPLAKAIEKGEYPLGIILCGSGNGAQMTANIPMCAPPCVGTRNWPNWPVSTTMPTSFPFPDVSSRSTWLGGWCRCFCPRLSKEGVMREESRK